MVAKVGTAIIETRVNTAKFTQGMNRIDKRMNNFSRNVSRMTTAVAALGGAAGMGILIKNTAAAAKEIDAYSSALNVSAETLMSWGEATKTVNIQQDKLGDILKDISEKIGDAYANKGGEAVEVLEKLGLSSAHLASLSPDKQLLEIAKNLDKVGTRAEKIQILEALASDASLLLPLLDKNASKLKDLSRQAIESGRALSNANVKKLSELDEKLNNLDKTISNKFAVTIADNAENIKIFADSIITLISAVTKAIGAVSEFSSKFGSNLATTIHGSTDALTLLHKRMAQTKALIQEQQAIIKNQGFFGMGGSTPEEIKAAEERIAALNIQLEKQEKILARLKESEGQPKPTEAPEEKKVPIPPIVSDETMNAFDEKAQERLSRVEEFLMTEQERIEEAYANRQFIIENAFESEHLSYERRAELLKQLEERKEEELTRIQEQGLSQRERFLRMSTTEQAKYVLGALESVTRGMAQSNKTMFKINKIAGIANAIINTSQGVTKALSAYPPPYSFVMAAAQLAAGMAQVNAIKSTSFGGGGSAPSTGGSGTAAAISTPSLSEQIQPARNISSEQRTLIVNLGEFDIAALPEKKMREFLTKLEDTRQDMGNNTQVIYR